jgi:excisionase family DNA binding protein
MAADVQPEHPVRCVVPAQCRGMGVPKMTTPAPIERDAFSVREIAERYGLHRDTIYQEINDGKLDALKVRGRTIITRDAVDAWRNSLPRLKRS